MLLDGTNFEGGGYGGHWCKACRQPILFQQPSTRIEFQNDPDGTKGLTGMYHRECGRPFASLARVVNLDPRTLR
jgi:hypothetical protein